MNNKRIVYIEDNLQSGRLVAKILNAQGYDVMIAETTETGLRLIESTDPDLILMDIDLPDMDGMEATAYLKQSAFQHIPVIAVTALAMRGDRERVMAAGCDDYLPKPIDVRGLLDAVQKHLGATASL